VQRLRQFGLVLGIFFLAMGCFSGCGGSAAQKAEEASTLKPLMVLYGRYVGQHQGKPPANEAEFRKYVEAQGPQDLANLGVTEPAKLWVSSRDNQPYVILYGDVTGPPGPAGKPVVAYEAKGVGGKRYVASSLGAVDEVDEARFRELVPAAVTTP
jgi:hypothetical protein